MSEWVDTSNELPPEGVWVLARLEGYGDMPWLVKRDGNHYVYQADGYESSAMDNVLQWASVPE